MKYFTLVGSRETPAESCDILEQMAYYLAYNGWTGRSGGADGADTALERALNLRFPDKLEVYLPWDNFNGRVIHSRRYLIDTPSLLNYRSAIQIAEQIHPAWERCSRGARALHTRNVYQVLGRDLQTPSKILVCWAIPTTSGVKGGTNTAVQLAKHHGCKILNIYGMSEEAAMIKLMEVLNDSE